MVVTSTTGSAGSFQRTVSNIGANIRNIFSGSPQAVIDTATGTYGTPSEVSNAPRRPSFVSGGGGGGGSAPAASGGTEAVLTQQGIVTAPAKGGVITTPTSMQRFSENARLIREAIKIADEKKIDVSTPIRRLNYLKNFVPEETKQVITSDGRILEINPQTGRPYGTVTAVEQKKIGEGGIQQYLERQRSRLATERSRAGEKGVSYGNIAKEIAVGAGTSVLGTGMFFQSLVTQPIETLYNIPSGIKSSYEFISSGGGAKVLRQEPAFVTGYIGAEMGTQFLFGKALKGDFTLFGKKPTQITATKEFEKAVQPFSRQRATLILRTDDGRYVLGRTRSGDIISIGGKIEKGQTTRQAITSELFQETGLSLKDLKNLKSKGNIITPEETFKVYSATIPNEALRKIVPSSDIKEISLISPKELKGISGQTARYPVKLPSGVRSYEAGIINWLETGTKPTLLKIESKMGEFYLGTQSRYDVPYSQQKKFFQGNKNLLWSSGTTEPAKLNRFLPIKKEFEVLASKSKRGKTKGLYLSPPVSAKGGLREVIKLEKYTGTGDIVKNVKNLPFNVPRKTPSGYVGLSYAGFGEDVSGGLGITFRKPRRTIYTLNEVPRSPIIKSGKTLIGQEVEAVIKPETFIKTKGGFAERFNIGGKRVFVQGAEIVKDAKTAERISKLSNIAETGTQAERIKALKQMGKITGVDYLEGSYTYVSPLGLGAKTLPFIKKEEQPSEERKTIQKEISYLREIPSLKEISRFKQEPSLKDITKLKEEPKLKETLKLKESQKLKLQQKPIIETPPKTRNFFRTKVLFGKITPPKYSTKVPKNIFSVSVRRGGKFRPYGKAPSLKEAFGLGKGYTLRTLGATFKVEGAGRIPQAPKGFYSKQEKGQTIFIQKRRGRLSSLGEREEISLARALSTKPIRKRRRK